MPEFSTNDLSKQDIVHLIEVGLKENQPFAQYFADTVLREIQNKVKNLKIQSSAIEIDGKGISEDINKRIRDGVDKEVDAAVKQTKDSINKASSEAKKIDSKESPLSLSSLIGQTPEMSKWTQVKYNSFVRTTLEKIQKGLPDVIELGKKEGISLNSIFRGPQGTVATASSLLYFNRWTKLQKNLIEKIQKGADKADFNFKNQITLGEVFKPPEGAIGATASLMYAFKWGKLQRSLLDKIENSLSSVKELSFKELTLDSILGEAPKAGLLTRLRYAKIRSDLLDKISKGSKDISFAKGSITESAPAKKEFRSLEEKEPVVKIGGYTKGALLQLSGVLGGKKVEAITKDKDDKGKELIPGWVKAIGLAGVALLGGGLLTLVSGFFDSGPFKGTKKILGTLAVKLGSVFVGTFVKLASKHIGTMFFTLAKTLGGVVGKLFPSVGVQIGKIGGKIGGNFLKMGATSLGKFLGPLLKKLPLIGSIISFSFAFSRFKSGDFLGGMLDMASGIAGLVPGIGTALAIGIDVISAIRDIKTPQEERVRQGGSGGIAIFKTISGLLSNVFGKAVRFLKFLPGIGSIFNFADAWKMFKSGNILKGLMSLVSGIANFVPGFGKIASIGIDVLNSFISPKREGVEEVKSEGKGNGFLATIKNFIKEKIMSGMKRLISLGMGLKDLFSGNVKKGLAKIAFGLGGIPGVGIVFNTISNWLGEPDDEEASSEVPTKKKSIFAAFKDLVYEKIKKGINKLPWWLKKVMSYIPGLGAMFSDIKDEDTLESFEESGMSEEEIKIEKQRKELENKRRQEERARRVEEQKRKLREVAANFKEKLSVGKAGLLDVGRGIGSKAASFLGLKKQAEISLSEKEIWQLRKKQIDKQETDSYIAAEILRNEKNQVRDGLRSLDEVRQMVQSEAGMAHDFIWRKGKKIQKFNADDNLIAVKDESVFNKVIGALNLAKAPQGDQTISSQGISKDNINDVLLKMDKMVNYLGSILLVSGQMVAAQTQAGQQFNGPPPAQNGGLSDTSGGDTSGIRDPAYILRGRAWDRIRKGYNLI